MFRFLGFIIGAVLVSALLLNAARDPDGLEATAEAAKRFLALPPADPTDPAPAPASPRQGFDASKVVDQIARVIAAAPEEPSDGDEPPADADETDLATAEPPVAAPDAATEPRQTASVGFPEAPGGFWDEAAPLDASGVATVPAPGPSAAASVVARAAPDSSVSVGPAPGAAPMAAPLVATPDAAPNAAPNAAQNAAPNAAMAATLPDYAAPPPQDDWHVIWTPFRSELSAKGFAEHLGQTTGYRFRVLRAGPGQYRVAVASAAGADPSESLRAIEAATGLALTGGTL